MQLGKIITDRDGRELTERGTPLFPLSVYDNDVNAFPSHFVPWHWHAECELVRIVEGPLLLAFAGTETVLQENDGAFLNSNALHMMKPAEAGGCRMSTVVFDAAIIGGAPASVFQSGYVLPVTQNGAHPAVIFRRDTDWGRRIGQKMAAAEQAYAAGDYGFELRIRSSLSEIWLILMQQMQVETGAPACTPDPYIRKLLAFIHGNFAEDLTLENIAASAGISCRTCSRVFRQQLQQSPCGYLTEYRIHKAAEKLLTTDLPVTDVCFSCGFQDPSYFTRRFRQLMGKSPRKYRQAASESLR